MSRALGFDAAQPGTRRPELLRAAATAGLVEETPTRFGVNYVVGGALLGPSGRSLRIRTIAISDALGTSLPFVAAHPFREAVQDADLEVVVLTSIEASDVGAVVQRDAVGEAFEAEFVNGEGRTSLTVTLLNSDVRRIGASETPHARRLHVA